MKTDRIYYTDPYAKEFDATVISVERIEGSAGPVPSGVEGRFVAVLDRTAFYPSSGGQPYDVGDLGGARVVDVVDRDDGTIAHVIEGELREGQVHGRIDWARRFDHMQQHTGQHILSAAFDRLFGVRTESFHLGTASSTIDLAREVTPAEVAAAESEANRVVWEDRPIAIRFADATEVAKMPLRKESKREGELRLIDVTDFDVSACGGTHVSRTGAIGVIALAGSERFRGGTRIEFLCGGRALDGYRALRAAVVESTRLLSVLPVELPAAIGRVQGDAKDLKRQLKDAQGRLAAFEAAELAAGAERHGDRLVTVKALEGWDQNSLKAIAASIAERPGHLAILIGLPVPAAIVVARAANVAVDSGSIVKAMAATFAGKGGGKPELAQGGGLQGSVADMLAAARELITSG
jgi:alanyl-tRNA synthetase